MKVTILGCGPSSGVPTITGDWGACDPDNPRNRRRRPSILVESGDTHILVDTSPDLMEQLLQARARIIDAVLFTHEHADHVMGIDDLRAVRRHMGRNIDAWAAPDVLESLKKRFGYLFSGVQDPENLYSPIYDPHAYSTDVVEMPPESLDALRGVDTWVVDCLRDGPAHPTHAHLEKTVRWIDHVKPRRAILTHMNFRADYEALKARCPAGVEPAWDGMVIEV